MKKEPKATQPVDVVRAWKDPAYRAGLTEEQRSQLPVHPAGLVELESLEQVRGGKCGVRTVPCY